MSSVSSFSASLVGSLLPALTIPSGTGEALKIPRSRFDVALSDFDVGDGVATGINLSVQRVN